MGTVGCVALVTHEHTVDGLLALVTLHPAVGDLVKLGAFTALVTTLVTLVLFLFATVIAGALTSWRARHFPLALFAHQTARASLWFAIFALQITMALLCALPPATIHVGCLVLVARTTGSVRFRFVPTATNSAHVITHIRAILP